MDGLILCIRGQRVIVDADLAQIYGVTTKRLNEAVKRNRERFPSDFVFQLTTAEKQEVVANCDHLRTLKFSPVSTSSPNTVRSWQRRYSTVRRPRR